MKDIKIETKQLSELKIHRVLSDIKLVDNLHIELHPNCTLDDIEDALSELTLLYTKATSEIHTRK